MDGLVLAGQMFRVVRRGSPATNAFIMRHEDLSNKELYTTKRMVHITEEGIGKDLLDLEITFLEYSISLAVFPPEEGVDRLRDKEVEETPCPLSLQAVFGSM